MFFLFGIPALLASAGSAAATAIGSAAGAAAAAAGSATVAAGSVAAAVGSTATAVGSAVTSTASAVSGALSGIGVTGGMGAMTKGVLCSVAKGAVGVAAKKTSVDTMTQMAALAIGATIGNKLAGQKRKPEEQFMKVVPRRGSILKVDLVGGVADHTGVYLGGGRIAEVTDVDGCAVVRVVDPDEFVSGDGLCRTGLHVYVACAREGIGVRPLASDSVARRAESAVGDRGGYNLVFNNCHMFTRYCITGENDGTPCFSVGAIESALKERFDVGSVCWCKADGETFA